MMLQTDCLDIVWRFDRVRSGDNAMNTRITRTEKLDLRLTAEAKHTLAAAAQAQRRSLSEFVLESALGRAEEALADRRVFFRPRSGKPSLPRWTRRRAICRACVSC